MRFLGLLLGIASILGGSLGGFQLMRNVGPENRAGEFSSSSGVPGGGTLFQSASFARVVAGLNGIGGRLENLSVQDKSASASLIAGGQRLNVQIDGAGRVDRGSTATVAAGAATVPLKRIDPAAMDRLVAGARRESRDATAQISSINLDGGNRQWTISLERGDVRTLIANLDGKGVRLPGEEDPAGPGSTPDSLLRRAGFASVLAAIRREAKGATKVDGLTVYPSYAVTRVPSGGRTLDLTIGFEGELKSRSLTPRTGAPTESITLERIRPDLVERMLALGRRHFRGIRIADVMYLTSSTNGTEATWNMYLTKSRYFVTDLGGRRLLSANP